MALIRWEPAAELNTIQSEMNRLFNTFFDQPGTTTRGSVAARRWVPAMDLVEIEDNYVLRADLPGMSEGDINIQLEDNVLTISGERKTVHEREDGGYHRIERSSGRFSRSLTLPEGIDAERIEAHFDRGVLEVKVPKPEQKKPRQVQITVGAHASDAASKAEVSKSSSEPTTVSAA